MSSIWAYLDENGPDVVLVGLILLGIILLLLPRASKDWREDDEIFH